MRPLTHVVKRFQVSGLKAEIELSSESFELKSYNYMLKNR
jgi:hypothetical protein